MASIAGHSGMHKLVDYCSSKFAAVGIDDAIKVELKVQGHADYIKTTVVCLEWVVKRLKILFTFPPWILMLCRYFVKRQGFYSKFWKLWLDCITAMINSGKKWIFMKKHIRPKLPIFDPPVSFEWPQWPNPAWQKIERLSDGGYMQDLWKIWLTLCNSFSH